MLLSQLSRVQVIKNGVVVPENLLEVRMEAAVFHELLLLHGGSSFSTLYPPSRPVLHGMQPSSVLSLGLSNVGTVSNPCALEYPSGFPSSSQTQRQWPYGGVGRSSGRAARVPGTSSRCSAAGAGRLLLEGEVAAVVLLDGDVLKTISATAK